MNSGKSTLLNALLFGYEVLPSATTTTTAKITLMEGSVSESVEATLYTPAEFQRVLEASKKDGKAAAELSSARNFARAAGIQESQLLTDPAHVERHDGLDGLFRFAAVSDKGGTYNVYVKSVLLRANRPWLHQVTVADTPGTNDPNPERDRITRDWIQRADAVVYVTFAGQAGMDNEDVKFIDEHLAHVSPTHRLIAVNKCDDEPDTNAIWRHIHKIRDSGGLRMKSLFRNDDHVVLVSGLGGLITAIQDSGREMSEDMRWYTRKMSANGYLEAERHGVEKLRYLIEQRIIANRGEGVIRAHQSRISNLFEQADRRLAREDVDLRNYLDAISASSAERAKEKERVRRGNSALEGVLKRTRTGIGNDLDALHSKLDDRLNEVAAEVKETIEDSLRGTTTIESLAAHARWVIQDALHEKRSTIAEHIRELMRGVERKLDTTESELSDEVMRSGFGTRVPDIHLLPVSARTICKWAEEELIANVDQVGLAEEVRRATNWWQRSFDRDRAKTGAIESLKPKLGKKLKDGLEKIPGHTERELKRLADKAVRSMEDSCRDSLDKRRRQLEALEEEDTLDEERRECINVELACVAERRRQVDALQDEYEAAVAARRC